MEDATNNRQSTVTVEQAETRRPDVWPESQEQLIRVSKQNLFWKIPKKWKEYILVVLGLTALVVIFLLTVLLVLNRRETISICTSPECIRSANNLLQSMDDSVEPCDNFYKYACDKWRDEHIMKEPRFIHNWFEERDKLIKRDILEYLEQEDSDDEPIAVHKARVVYEACLDFVSINDNGLETLWNLLEEIGLPKMPLLETNTNQHWIRSEAKIRRYLGKEILIGFGVMTSLHNSTQNQLAVATTDATEMFLRWRWTDTATETFLKKSLHRANSDVIRLWKKFSVELISYFVKNVHNNVDDLDDAINTASLRILQMKQNLSEIENSDNVIGPFLNDIPDVMKLSELQELVDNSSTTGESKIVWETYFESLFEDVEELDFSDDKILVYKKPYYELLSEYLDGLSDKDLELLLWWEVIYALAPHVHEELKTYKDVYTSKVLSVSQLESRESECANMVYTFMEAAVGYSAVPKIQKNLINSISEMISNIQEAFVQSVYDLLWMDGTTKMATIEKIKSIKKFIGAPDWITDKEELDSEYNITVNSTTHLNNLLVLMDSFVLETLLALRTENNNSISEFQPLDINAYYDPSGNAISVPAALMQFPFYDLGLEALNYGAIGSILGHEMTHGLDSYGRQFDSNGNLKKWWTNKSIVEYEKRTACYVQSYNNYLIPSINETVNGNVTLSENLADDGGLRNAFSAYNMYISRNNIIEPRLPGLEHLSHEKLFFLAHANMWCAEYTDEALSDTISYDEHSPQFVRVNRVIQNMPEFAGVWNCPVGSKMNPTKKCKLWID